MHLTFGQRALRRGIKSQTPYDRKINNANQDRKKEKMKALDTVNKDQETITLSHDVGPAQNQA